MPDNRPRIWFSVFVLAVFCVGLTAGVLLGRRMAGPPERPFGELGRPPGTPGLPGPGGRRGGPPPAVLLDRLDRELSLTPDQRGRIDVVLRSSRQRLDELQQQTHAKLEAEQRDLREQIRKELTPQQQQAFDRWAENNQPRGPGRRGRPPGAMP
jgi:hypothetical protein